ncbi:unnamed protein product [Lactuca saligna]|uniref:Uncharacterized protein n=1 Tax=Lactuca saligna TaxID=75948 RepID=A0AA35ZBA2_LACSI|nr:unnamed protein product [Lactuca saligna]
MLKKDKMLLMKNSDQNETADQPQMFIKEVGKRKFVDRYGDRSEIRMWGFEADRNMWIVKRKSFNIEYYVKKIDFMSWEKVDLADLVHTPFHNPTNDPNAWAFKRFLEDKAKMNFVGMKTVASFIKMSKGFLDPHTNKTLLMMENEMFEAAAKTFTGMIAAIIDKEFWAGALGDSDVHIVDKP